MKSIKARIEEIKANGYQLNFETVFNLAFENYKKIALYAGLLIFVSVVLLAIFASIFIAAFFGMPTLTKILNPEYLNPEHFSDTFLLIYIMAMILFTSLISPLSAGLIKMAYCAERDEEFHVSTVFEYYRAPYFKELFIATLIISIISSGFSAALNFTTVQYLGTLISLGISFLTILTIPLIIFSNLKAVDAINSSIVIVLKQPLILLGLLIISYIAFLVGFFFCFIGIFFTIPFMYSMYYAIYSTIIGFNNLEENN
jgi:hypothetical protein